MSDTNSNDLDDDEPYFADLVDISDVTVDMIPRKSRREVLFIVKSKSDFNLIKLYLALKNYTEKIEDEIGVLAEADGEH
jgi:hypothetical protein